MGPEFQRDDRLKVRDHSVNQAIFLSHVPFGRIFARPTTHFRYAFDVGICRKLPMRISMVSFWLQRSDQVIGATLTDQMPRRRPWREVLRPLTGVSNTEQSKGCDGDDRSNYWNPCQDGFLKRLSLFTRQSDVMRRELPIQRFVWE